MPLGHMLSLGSTSTSTACGREPLSLWLPLNMPVLLLLWLLLLCAPPGCLNWLTAQM